MSQGGEFAHICYLEDGIILAGGSNNTAVIARSTDFGKTWTAQNSFLVSGTAEYEFDSFAYLGNGIVLAGSNTDLGNSSGHPGGRVWRSTDYGQTWSYSALLDATTQFIGTICNLGGGVVIAGTGSGHILRSTDYGVTWTDQGQTCSATVINDSTYLGRGIVVAVGAPATIIRSTDYGATWTMVAPYMNGSPGRICHLDAITGIVLTNSGLGHVFRSVDYGATWTDLGQQGDSNTFYSFAYVGGGLVMAGKEITGHVLRSLDWGITWTDLGAADSCNIECMCHLGEGVLLCGTDASGKLWRSAPVVEVDNPTDTLDHIAADANLGLTIGTVGGASGQKLGFYATTPITQALLATGVSHTVDDVITALQNLGLVRQS